MGKSNFSTVDAILFNKLHQEDNISLRQIAKQFDTCHRVIKRHLIKHGYSYVKRRYSLNEDYFNELDDPQKLYFLGWIYSDGNVFDYPDKKYKGFSIKIQKKDSYILEYFKELLQAEHPIKLEKQTSGYCIGNEYAKLQIGSSRIYNDLLKYGLMPRKTFLLKYPHQIVTDHRPFILGIFDGNGGISFNPVSKMANFAICGTKDVLIGIRDVFQKEIGLVPNKLSKNKSIYRLSYGGVKPVVRIAEWLYSWNPPVNLKRKKEKFDMLLDVPKYGKNMLIFKCPECGHIGEFEKRMFYQLKKYKFKSKFCSLSCSGKFNRKFQLNGCKLTLEMEQMLKENIRGEKKKYLKTKMNIEGLRTFTPE
ncbi:hypothetical protein SAMN04488137_4695 [Fictibacillus solisalsi]|uniref:DOD-type homing endonuclease domain-containing protein n=1 Tax=Fictibacillus solisalsi TaxID=459525 RepID=A0A1H0BYA6_9BACL|nr:hypothetical protein [Fictibacillus solisalsi]SDN50671.1 hypothetical protein SAMN04488137_4695 [Fictibacillus solisalsi]